MRTIVWLAATFLCIPLAFSGQENKPINVTPRQEFKLTLESNPSTGNQWLLAKPLDERLLKLLGTEYRRSRSGTPGAPGTEILSFKALAEGKTEIHLKYGRLWEQEVAPSRRTNFVVVISR